MKLLCESGEPDTGDYSMRVWNVDGFPTFSSVPLRDDPMSKENGMKCNPE